MFLYVLWLRHKCFYVGVSKNPMKRAFHHVRGDGAAWTRKHKPLTPIKDNILIEDLGDMSIEEAEEIEDRTTESMQKEYGLNMVRGGYTVQCHDLSDPPDRKAAKRSYHEACDRGPSGSGRKRLKPAQPG